MLSLCPGELARILFLPDWKVRVTEEGRERLRQLMTPDPFLSPVRVPSRGNHKVTLPDGQEVTLGERVHQAFYETLPTSVPGVYVRRPK